MTWHTCVNGSWSWNDQQFITWFTYIRLMYIWNSWTIYRYVYIYIYMFWIPATFCFDILNHIQSRHNPMPLDNVWFDSLTRMWRTRILQHLSVNHKEQLSRLQTIARKYHVDGPLIRLDYTIPLVVLSS